MTLLLMQMFVVLLVALGCGWVARKLGQTRVIGEIAGGILVGPSVFGRLAPHASAALFPQSSLGSFEVLSTIGLVLFLFLIGMELDYRHLREQRGTAALTSAMSIVLPFLLAMGMAHAVRVRFAPEGIGAAPFMLFLGISMSITAFPVLARILEERKLESTPLGVSALLCAAADDVCAWMLLAVALTLISNDGTTMSIGVRALWLAGYVGGMLGVVRPIGVWLAGRRKDDGLSYEALAFVVAAVMASAAATNAIGVHPLFGAFLAGLCFPRIARWQREIRSKLETIVSALLLPLFFAVTGLRIRLDLLSGGTAWVWTGVILVAAIAGKMGGAMLAARWAGQTWRDAMALGALLNTRGLVELIVLNIAYNAHVFSPTLFTMLVVMALVTTAMTTPILNGLGVGERAS